MYVGNRLVKFDPVTGEAVAPWRQRQSDLVQGHAKALKKLRSLNPYRVVMEATGVYYLDLALVLHQAGLPLSAINPKSFRHFAELKLKGSKTDAIDSALLAEYGECLNPPLWTPPPATRLAVRDLGRQINRLVHARTQAKNRLHALSAKQGTLKMLLEDEQGFAGGN